MRSKQTWVSGALGLSRKITSCSSKFVDGRSIHGNLDYTTVVDVVLRETWDCTSL